MRVLLVENERVGLNQIDAILKGGGIHIERTNTGRYALDLLAYYNFDIVVISLALPDMPGSTLISRMREARHNTPVLAFSRSLHIDPKLKALTAGADDVVDQNIEPAELLARVSAIVRRYRGQNQTKLQVGAITLDTESQAVLASGIVVSLTAKEFGLLYFLMQRKNTVLSKQAILVNLYGGMNEPEIKIVDIFICKLRKKLAVAGSSNVISTVWGCGYTIRDRLGSVPNASVTAALIHRPSEVGHGGAVLAERCTVGGDRAIASAS